MTAYVVVGGFHGDDEEGQSESVRCFRPPFAARSHAHAAYRFDIRSGGSLSRAGGGVKI
jgi:hypothetical protein